MQIEYGTGNGRREDNAPDDGALRLVRPWRQYRFWPTAYFVLLHLAALVGLFLGPTLQDWLIFGVLYVVRVVGITLGYHRLLAHHSFRVNRALQFLLAVVGASALQKGPLWWSYYHRLHHRFADTKRDPHTPRKGWFYSHVGWVLSDEYRTIPAGSVPDLRRQPELVLLNRLDFLPGVLTITALWFATGRITAILVGFGLSTVCVYHAIFASNSLAHRPKARRADMHDDSQNSIALAILIGGDGWHAAHHEDPRAARHWTGRHSFDVNYMIIRIAQSFGIAHDVRERARG